MVSAFWIGLGVRASGVERCRLVQEFLSSGLFRTEVALGSRLLLQGLMVFEPLVDRWASIAQDARDR